MNPKKVPVTVLLAVKNEALNLPKCLLSLQPAEKVVVLDSHSTDGTQQIALQSGAEVVQFDYRGGYPQKRQWAMDTLTFTTPWILLIDADEEVPDLLWDQIRSVTDKDPVQQAFLIQKEFHFLGKKFRFGGFSFDAILLFRPGKARFEQLMGEPFGSLDMEVHERVIVNGAIGRLDAPLIHRDFKSLESFIDRHNKYSTWDARLRRDFFSTRRFGHDPIRSDPFGNVQERRRFLKLIAIKVPFEPTFWFLYHFVLRLGFLEGKRGYIASRMRANHIFQIRAKLYEMNLDE